MKRILAMILLVCFMGAAVGCASKTPDNSQTEETGKTLSRGTIVDDVYTSEFMGVSFRKPKGWVYSTDEEIAAVMQIGADLLNTDEFLEQAAKMTPEQLKDKLVIL